MRLTAEEIEAGKTPRGGWPRKQLAAWGVPWPPPKGWRRALLDGRPIPVPGERKLRGPSKAERAFRAGFTAGWERGAFENNGVGLGGPSKVDDAWAVYQEAQRGEG